MKLKALMLAACLGLTACAEGSGNNEAIGTLLGAGLGALLGSQVGRDGSGAQAAAITMGAIGGGLLGNQIGRRLDEADRLKAQQARYDALEYGRSGEQSGWYNPESGNSGWYEPEPAYRSQDGRYCREYQSEITVDGRPERGYGTACRQPDGSWEIVG